MENSLKHPLVEDETPRSSGEGEVPMEIETLDDGPSLSKRRCHSSGGLWDEADGIGKNPVNFILISDSEDDDADITDWYLPSIGTAQTKCISTIHAKNDSIEVKHSYTNQDKSLRNVAPKAFWKVETNAVASERNCLSDQILRENGGATLNNDNDIGDSFSSLPLQTEYVGSNLKNLNSLGSPDKNTLNMFKANFANFMKKQTMVPLPKHSSIEQEDYSVFNGEKVKNKSGSLGPSSEPINVIQNKISDPLTWSLPSSSRTRAVPYHEGDAMITTSTSESDRPNVLSKMDSPSRRLSMDSTNHDSRYYHSNNQSSLAGRVSIKKVIPSLQQDAQNIANILGSSAVDIIYEKLKDRQQENNSVESVMNDILEGNIVLENGTNDAGVCDVVCVSGANDKNDEDLFLHDVDQLVRKFPDVDQFEIYNRLSVLCGDDDRLDIVLKEMKKSGHVDLTQMTSVGDNANPLYGNMIEISRLFPNKDRNEIYAYLEAHSFKPDRVEVVMQEFLGMSQDREVKVVKGKPVASSASSSATGALGTNNEVVNRKTASSKSSFATGVTGTNNEVVNRKTVASTSKPSSATGVTGTNNEVVNRITAASKSSSATGVTGTNDEVVNRKTASSKSSFATGVMGTNNEVVNRKTVASTSKSSFATGATGTNNEVVNRKTVASTSKPSSAIGVTGTNNYHDLLILEQVENLSAIFPDCDPSDLAKELEGTKNDPDRVKNLASAMFDRRNYLRKKDTFERQRKQGHLKAVEMLINFKLNEFLDFFPDPIGVFYDEWKPVSELYKKHVFFHLMNTFPFLQETHIKTVMMTHKTHLTTSLRELEKEVAAADIKSKQYGLKYQEQFLKIKQSGSRNLKFPDEPDEYFYKELAFTRNEEKIKDHLATQKKVRECMIEAARKNGELYKCQCCFDDEILFEEMKACTDGHLFCGKCVRQSAEWNIGSGKLKFPCLNKGNGGECEESFTMETLQEVLPSSVFSRLQNNIWEEELRQAGIENLVSCPCCSFATVMEDENDKVVRCQNPECLRESCQLCQQPNHTPLTCEEAENRGQSHTEILNEAVAASPVPPPRQDNTLMSSHIPKHWDIDATNDDTVVKYVKLNDFGNTAGEFRSVALKFKATMPNSQIKSIERVQSMEIFDAFDRKRNWMLKRNKMDAIDLFHGTAEANIKAICEQGFDWRICGSKHGTAYGKGTYFGATAITSADYVERSAKKTKTMLVCKVLVGETCLGNGSYVRPPPKDPRRDRNANFYDSCVNHLDRPSIYVIFDRDQAYPEYVIKYR